MRPHMHLLNDPTLSLVVYLSKGNANRSLHKYSHANLWKGCITHNPGLEMINKLHWKTIVEYYSDTKRNELQTHVTIRSNLKKHSAQWRRSDMKDQQHGSTYVTMVGLENEPRAFPLSYTPSLFFTLRQSLMKLPRLSWNLWPSFLRFPAHWDYRHVPSGT